MNSRRQTRARTNTAPPDLPAAALEAPHLAASAASAGAAAGDLRRGGPRSHERSHSRESAFNLTRRCFVQVLGAGLLVTVFEGVARGQRSRGGGGGGRRGAVSARVHIGRDGTITVLTGKVEMGQGARAELTQAAAEELHVPPEQIRMVMADTGLVPDDGITAGSRTTPSTVPAVRQGAAAARDLLVGVACRRWNLEPAGATVRDGTVTHASGQKSITYAELARTEDLSKALGEPIPAEVTPTPVKSWRVLGTSFARPNRRDLVTGAHQYPSDFTRPGLLHGRVLRPPGYGARLVLVDLAPADAMPGVVAVREGDFVGVAAPTTHRATRALEAIAQTARWEPAAHPSSRRIYEHLRERARLGDNQSPFEEELARAAQVLRQTYHVAYVQHAPMETRVAVAEWNDGRLTVWTGTQNPFGYRSELARVFGLSNEQVRVVVPDFGCGFGGKHTGEAAVEAARLAKAAGHPVKLKWTREEEFTWAYFRPAAVIEVTASLDDQGSVSSWHFVNINSGGAAVDTPYRIARARSRFVPSDPPLRQGSYRTLAATANNFARECFMDELAVAASADPLEFRLAHLDNPRLRAVLQSAAQRFDWKGRRQQRQPGTGVGLACGTEKGSYVAACVEIAVDRERGRILVRHVSQVFECGAILNPDNLLAQVQGCILMGLGPALAEEVQFEQGRMLTNSFGKYRVPRFRDVPPLDIHLLDRPDLPSVGGGETPIIAIAPAIGNALFDATGTRLRAMPLRPPA